MTTRESTYIPTASGPSIWSRESGGPKPTSNLSCWRSASRTSRARTQRLAGSRGAQAVRVTRWQTHWPEKDAIRAPSRGGPLPGRAPEVDHPAHTEAFQAYTVKLMQAAKQHFPLALRNPWITDETLRSLAAARVAQANGADDWKQLRNQAKRAARKDRVKWVHDQLLGDPSGTQSTVWNTVRRQRRGFQGRRTHLVVDGKPVDQNARSFSRPFAKFTVEANRHPGPYRT